MKLEPLTEPDERKTATLKKFDNQFKFRNSDIIATFTIYPEGGFWTYGL